MRDDHGGYRTIDAPGAGRFTVVLGAGEGGRIVGAVVDTRERLHGFVQQGRDFRRVDFPGAAATVVTKVNAGGQMVGMYSDRPDTPALRGQHGFWFDGRRFRRISVAGSTATRPFGIDRAGRIVGEFVDRAGASHGFLRGTDGRVTTVDVPDAKATLATDVDDQGRIVGTSVDAAGVQHGFVRAPDATYTTFDVGGSTQTVALGTNNRGQIAGYYGDQNFTRGFVRDPDGRITEVEVPDAVGRTDPYDIDDSGRVVGGYDVVGGGYLRTGQGASARTERIDAPGATTETVPFGLTEQGEMVGGYDPDAPRSIHGFHRDRRGRYSRIDFPGAPGSAATRVNDRGQVVGIYNPNGVDTKVPEVRGFLLDRGRYVSIDVPGARSTTPLDINDRRQIVGIYTDSNGAPRSFLQGPDGRFTDVEVPGATATQVTSLNDHGQMVGYFQDTEGAFRGFRRDADGTVTVIDPPSDAQERLPGIVGGVFPFAINNRGQIVGQYTESIGLRHGFMLDRGRFTLVQGAAALYESFPLDIDDQGRIVGFAG